MKIKIVTLPKPLKKVQLLMSTIPDLMKIQNQLIPKAMLFGGIVMKQKVAAFLKNLKLITMITVTMMIMVTTATDTIVVLQKN